VLTQIMRFWSRYEASMLISRSSWRLLASSSRRVGRGLGRRPPVDDQASRLSTARHDDLARPELQRHDPIDELAHADRLGQCRVLLVSKAIKNAPCRGFGRLLEPRQAQLALRSILRSSGSPATMAT
jgi:hypothetical protein